MATSLVAPIAVVTAWCRRSHAPGSPEKSFLVDKLTGHLSRDEGKLLPLDPDTGAPRSPTIGDRSFDDSILISWIRTGARPESVAQ